MNAANCHQSGQQMFLDYFGVIHPSDDLLLMKPTGLDQHCFILKGGFQQFDVVCVQDFLSPLICSL